MGGSGSNPKPASDPSSVSSSPSERTDSHAPHILIAEDNKSDVFLIRQALKRSDVQAQVQVAEDGEKAVLFFEQVDADPSIPCPDLILLDINLPRYKGGEILRRLRASSRSSRALVVIVTSSDSQSDRQEMKALGANAYFRKPSDFLEFMQLGPLVRDLLAGREKPPAASS